MEAVTRYVKAGHSLQEARYKWYLAFYEKKLSIDSEEDITDEQMQSVVHAYGRALSERMASLHILLQILGL